MTRVYLVIEIKQRTCHCDLKDAFLMWRSLKILGPNLRLLDNDRQKIFFIDHVALATAIVLENYRAICNLGSHCFTRVQYLINLFQSE